MPLAADFHELSPKFFPVPKIIMAQNNGAACRQKGSSRQRIRQAFWVGHQYYSRQTATGVRCPIETEG